MKTFQEEKMAVLQRIKIRDCIRWCVLNKEILELSVNEGPEQGEDSGSPEPSHPSPALNKSSVGQHRKCEGRIAQENKNIIFFPNELDELTLNNLK